MTEMLIVYGIVCVPLIAVGLYALYRTNKEERKEQMQAKNA
jgi:ABC-type Co2+ transport system permease subunit